MQELADINNQPPAGCTINTNENDINNWEIIMQGPAESVYEVCLAICSHARLAVLTILPGR
jgi:ubiquitin-protein ligase